MSVKFDMIGLFVSDLPRMIEFYRDVVGLEIEWEGEESYVEFTHDGIRFSMFERKKLPDLLGQTPSFPDGINGSFELSINVGEPANVDVTFSKFIEGGAMELYAPRDEPWKMRSAMISDPEGNLIEIASDFWE